MSQSGNIQPMPQYQCHKKVWALKIKEIQKSFPTIEELDEILNEGREPEGAILRFEEEGFLGLEVPQAYISKHNPQVGGYYVVYEDGYQSFSPAKSFEEGYTLIPSGPKAHQDRVIAERQELQQRIMKLALFIEEIIYKTLPSDEQERLTKQLWYMKDYENILTQRIANFK